MKTKLFFSTLAFIIITGNCFAQELTMFQGFWSKQYYQDDQQLSKQEFETIMLSDKAANQLWQKSKKQMTISYVALAAELGFFIWYINRTNNNKSSTGPFIGVLGTAAIGVGFALSSNNLKKKSILLYNKNKEVSAIHIGPTYNGLGIVCSF